MSLLTQELLKNISEKKDPLSDLLYKAKIIGTKLNDNKFVTWVDKESKGYGNNKVPEYRIVTGAPKGFNPVNGWIPIAIPDQDLISKREVGQSIGQLENLMNRGQKGHLIVRYPPDVEKNIRELISENVEIVLFIDSSEIIGIFDGVRNNILDWVLKINENEKELKNNQKTVGILNEGEDTMIIDNEFNVDVGVIDKGKRTTFVRNKFGNNFNAEKIEIIKIEQRGNQNKAFLKNIEESKKSWFSMNSPIIWLIFKIIAAISIIIISYYLYRYLS